ncbi:MAG: hypothetical protein ACOX2I_08560 [Candidatus Ozemobacteraceae bacterium]|jgi:hypothetical protein|nr:hypothetical protein [Candidatus Riflebacteria bacterium]
MGSIFVLIGTLMLMYSLIIIVGENLKDDLFNGIAALLLYPIFVFYYSLSINYKKGHRAMFIGVCGFLVLIIGRIIGLE